MCVQLIAINYMTFGLTLLVAQFVEALRYKPEYSGLDCRWFHCKSSLTYVCQPH
jgi:hypothetical protein